MVEKKELTSFLFFLVVLLLLEILLTIIFLPKTSDYIEQVPALEVSDEQVGDSFVLDDSRYIIIYE